MTYFFTNKEARPFAICLTNDGDFFTEVPLELLLLLGLATFIETTSPSLSPDATIRL